jgi:hypothetical protein
MTSASCQHPIFLPVQYQHTSGMRNHRTPDTRNVTTQKRHTRLLETTELVLWLAQGFVNLFDRLFKCRELDHGIRNLPSPQRKDALIQARVPLLLHDLGKAFPQGVCERRQCRLHAHLDSLQRAQRNIGKELGRGRGSEEHDRLVHVGCELVAIDVLEDLVEAVLAGALERVADKGGCPTEKDASEAFFAIDLAPGFRSGFVEFGIDLAAAFDLSCTC